MSNCQSDAAGLIAWQAFRRSYLGVFIPALTLMFCNAAYAQLPIGFGLKGGVALTDAFGLGGQPPSVSSKSAAKDYLAGFSAEFRLPSGLSVEADALYRPVSLEFQYVVTSGSPPQLTTTTWEAHRYTTVEFPVLAKYRLPLRHIKPIIEAGPCFRAGGNAYGLNHAGFTAGGGVEFKLPPIRISSDLRYTRWSNNSSIVYQDLPNLNQIELLFGISF